MKCFDRSFIWLPREQWKIIDIPDDITVISIRYHEDNEVTLNYSEIEKQWFSLINISDPSKDVYFALLSSGTWLDCCQDLAPLDYTDAPFRWGQPLTNKYSPSIQYTPIWESVPTGKYDDDGIEIKKEEYKIIRSITPSLEDHNVNQFNYYSKFSIDNFGSDLYEIVRAIETYTNEKF